MHWQGTSNKNSAWGLSLVLAVGVCCLAACVKAGSAPQKRLIGHGWDLLGVSPVEVARHADALAKTGLDGISLSLRAKLPDGSKLNFSSILTDPPWTKEAFADQIAALRTLQGKPGLSHCVLSAFWTPAHRLAWNDDAAWARAIGNMKVLAEIAHDTKIDGLLIDPEDYSMTKQFRHQAADGDFESACRLARKRGNEFIDAVASVHPRAKLLFFWLLSLSYQDFSTVSDPQQALRACTINPARAIGADKVTGSIAVGKRADLIAVNEKLELTAVFIRGERHK